MKYSSFSARCCRTPNYSASNDLELIRFLSNDIFQFLYQPICIICYRCSLQYSLRENAKEDHRRVVSLVVNVLERLNLNPDPKHFIQGVNVFFNTTWDNWSHKAPSSHCPQFQDIFNLDENFKYFAEIWYLFVTILSVVLTFFSAVVNLMEYF